jgi:hypothetical protein
MKIAICNDIAQFHQDRLNNRDWSEQFLGSAFVTSLYERQEELGIEIHSGDVALKLIHNGQWLAHEVHVVQEMDARHGEELCRLGAIPSVLTIFESPLVAYRSIDRLLKTKVQFKNCIGPKDIFQHIPALNNAHVWPLSFPGFWSDQSFNSVPWEKRKNVVLVAANKYWHENKWPQAKSLKDALRIIRHGIRKQLSPTYQTFKSLQLHDQRLELIENLAARNMIDVYGRGWNTLNNLPAIYSKYLNNFPAIFKGPCTNKHDVLGQYKFAITYENTNCPGYVTEKVFDALAAQSIPIYLGAPDICDYLPSNAFIDARKLGSSEAIINRLAQITSSEAAEMIAAGQEFLGSPKGTRHSYDGFADWILSLITTEEHA